MVKDKAKSINPDEEEYAAEDYYAAKVCITSASDIVSHRSVPDHECPAVKCAVVLANDEGYYVAETYNYIKFIRAGGYITRD